MIQFELRRIYNINIKGNRYYKACLDSIPLLAGSSLRDVAFPASTSTVMS